MLTYKRSHNETLRIHSTQSVRQGNQPASQPFVFQADPSEKKREGVKAVIPYEANCVEESVYLSSTIRFRYVLENNSIITGSIARLLLLSPKLELN